MGKLARIFPFLLVALTLATPARAQIGFGSTVLVDEDEVFVGEPGNLITPGYVYVFRRGDDGWTEAARLSRVEAGEADGFGAALDVEGDALAVGADRAGTVTIFREKADGWTASATLSADAGLAESDGENDGNETRFGSAVALGPDTVLIGAPGEDDGRGAAYLFRRTADGWTRVARLAPADDGLREFGAAVALDGDRALVAAPGASGDLATLSALGSTAPPGRVLVYRRAEGGTSAAAAGGSGGDRPAAAGGGDPAAAADRGGDRETWEQVAVLGADDPEDALMLGRAVALRGDDALVGAPGHGNGTGAVHVFRRGDGDAWERVRLLQPFDAEPQLFFGASLALADGDAWIGAPGVDGFQGRVYRFRRDDSGDWVAARKLSDPDVAWGTVFGLALAARPGLLVAGMPGDDFGAGSAVILEAADPVAPLADAPEAPAPPPAAPVADVSTWSRSKVLSEATGLEAITGETVECVDGKAGIFPCDNVDLVAFLPVHAMGGGRGVTTNDMWGWQDPESGREYAVVGMRDGTAFVDVTDPSNPTFVGKLPRTEGSPPSLWRDIKIHADHAFVVADASGEHGMQVFDLTKLREFDGEPLPLEADAHYDHIHSAHNLAINQESGFAYAVGASGGGESCGGGLHMINIEDPRNPFFEGCFQDTATGRLGTGSSHDAQCVIYQGPDERYRGREICFGFNETAVSIADVTDKRAPVAIARATYPNVAYTHQGWLTEDHRYFFVNDEGDEVAGTVEGTRTLIFDVEELDDPILVAEHVTDSPATDHNLYIRGDTMYQSNYRSGLWVYDIADPESPRLIGRFDTVPWGEEDGMGDILSGAIGSWSNYPFFEHGVVGVTSGKEGLFLVRLRRPAATPGNEGS